MKEREWHFVSSQAVSPCLGWGLRLTEVWPGPGPSANDCRVQGQLAKGPVCFLIHHCPENNHPLGQSGLRGSKATGLPSLTSWAFWRT